MSESNVDVRDRRRPPRKLAQQAKPATKPTWETPKLEDVSEQVMAQPYIRFT